MINPPPPITPQQFIALLDELALVACAERRKKRDGQIIYSLSVADIYEGDAILSGKCRKPLACELPYEDFWIREIPQDDGGMIYEPVFTEKGRVVLENIAAQHGMTLQEYFEYVMRVKCLGRPHAANSNGS